MSDVFEPQGNLFPISDGVKGDVVPDDLLLQSFEVEIPTIAKQLRAVVFVANMERIATKEMDEIGKCICAAVRDGGRQNGWWSEETFS